MRFRQCLYTLLSVCLLSGCLEMQINGELRPDGSGELEFDYLIVKEFFFGKYSEPDNNRVLPLNEEQIKTVVDSFPGTALLWANVSDEGEQATIEGRRVNVMRIRYRFAFRDINDIHTNHFRFAFYPYDGKNLFQFRVDKAVPTPEEVAMERPNVNPLANAVTANRKLTLNMALPLRPTQTNGVQQTHTLVAWQIPISELVASRTPTIVAWADMPGTATNNPFKSTWQRFVLSDWQRPENFPVQKWFPELVTVPAK